VIIIPSTGRATLRDGTIASLAHLRPLIVCPDAERLAYVAAWPGLTCIPFTAPTLSLVIQHILDVANQPRIIVCDDDLKFAMRRGAGTTLSSASVSDITDAIDWVYRALATHAHAGISARFGNNTVDANVKTIGPIRSILGLRVDVLRAHGVRADRLPSKADYDLTLQLLELGYANVINYRYTHDQVGGPSLPGGCTSYRGNAMHTEAAVGLAKLHPDVVTTVVKDAKQWDGMARTDVRVQWKKAYESGVAEYGKRQP
jgi:hypothetical protein